MPQDETINMIVFQSSTLLYGAIVAPCMPNFYTLHVIIRRLYIPGTSHHQCRCLAGKAHTHNFSQDMSLHSFIDPFKFCQFFGSVIYKDDATTHATF